MSSGCLAKSTESLVIHWQHHRDAWFWSSFTEEVSATRCWPTCETKAEEPHARLTVAEAAHHIGSVRASLSNRISVFAPVQFKVYMRVRSNQAVLDLLHSSQSSNNSSPALARSQSGADEACCQPSSIMVSVCHGMLWWHAMLQRHHDI